MRISNNFAFSSKMPTFKAGKTTLYTDFDGTYFPFSQESVAYKDKKEVKQVNKMYSSIRDFVSMAKDKFSILITTGRSKIEMFGMINDFKKADVSFNFPDGYVFRDGFEESKDALIGDDITSPEALKQREEIKQVLLGVDDSLTIIEPLSNNWINGKEKSTLETLFKKLDPSERKKYVSVVAEDNGMLELAFTPDIDFDPYIEDIRKYFEAKNQQVDIKSYKNDRDLYIPYQEDESSEKFTFKRANTVFIKPVRKEIPDKLNKPKEQIRNIIANNSNDLVLVAGDNSNDLGMLNLLNYVDIFDVNVDKNKSMSELLSQDDVIDAISKLPIAVIVAGEDDSLNSIVEMKEILDQKGIRKIFVAKNPRDGYLANIKQAMLSYSSENNEYQSNLGPELYKDLLA